MKKKTILINTGIESCVSVFRRWEYIMMLAFATILAANAVPTVHYVNVNVLGGDSTGSSWANASPDLQAMIEASNGGDTIWVAAGVYVPVRPANAITTVDSTNRNNAFVLKEGVKIFGGFTGAETTFSQCDRISNPTILSGIIGNSGTDADSVYHVVIASTSSIDSLKTAELNGFTIRGGNANGSNNITVNGQNIPRFYGGGIFNRCASPVYANINVIKNSASSGGGGIFNFNASPTFTNDTIGDNSVNNGSGGGIYNNESSPAFSGIVVIGNSVNNGSGGGIYNDNSSPVITNVIISGNRSNSGGGMYNGHSSSPFLVNVLISGNSVNNEGGGLYNNASFPVLINITISGNSAGSLGGGTVNKAGGRITLQNSITAGNTATDAPDCWVDGDLITFTDVSHSLIGNTTYTTGKGITLESNCLTDTSALFVSPAHGDYRLLTLSPAINAGDTTLFMNALNLTSIEALLGLTDLDGNPRLISKSIDMGAYETNAFQVTFHFEQRPDSILNIASGDKLIEPVDPDSTGYAFYGWFTDTVTFAGEWDFDNYTVTQDTTLYAKWKKLHTVTYLYNPGGATYKTDTVPDNEKAVAPAPPDSIHLTFGNWYDTNDYSGLEWDFNNLISQDTIFYARWLAHVTFDTRGGVPTSLNNDTTLFVDSVIHAANWPDPINPPFTFEGWYTDTVTYQNKWHLDTDAVTRDTTLYARWVAKVTFEPNGGTLLTSNDTTVNAKTPVYAANWPDPVHPTLTFEGWYTDDGTFTDKWDLDADSVTRDTTLYAHWMAEIIYMREQDVVFRRELIEYDSLTVQPSPAPDSTGFAFAGWYRDAGGATPWDFATDSVKANMTLYAKWTLLTLKVILPNPDHRPGLTGVTIISSSGVMQVSDTVYFVQYGRNFSFRPVYDIDHSDTASVVTANNLRIHPGIDSIYTLTNVQAEIVIDIQPVFKKYKVEPPIVLPDGPDIYEVNSGDNFIFKLSSNIIPEGMELDITTGREDDATGGITITLKDDEYEVVIHAIREDIDIRIEFVPTGNETIPAAKIWSYGNMLYITPEKNGEAFIYDISGILTKTLPYFAGETAKIRLDSGIYIVVIGDKACKVIIK